MAQHARGLAVAGTSPAHVETGRIIDVHPESRLVTVATQITGKILHGLSYASPYLHYEEGEGIHVVPEVGGICWVCTPSDGNMAFVLGWAPAYVQGQGYKANRPDMNPGDIFLGTRAQNNIFLRRSGIIQIAASPLCQRIYLPVENTIRDICQSYLMATLAGSLEWSVGGINETPTGARPTALKVLAKYRANDAKPIAELVVGSHDDDTILSLKIAKDGTGTSTTQIDLKMGKDGTVSWKVEDSWKLETKGDITIKSATNVGLEASLEFKAKGATVKVEADNTVTINAGTTATIKATSITLDAQVVSINGTQILLGGDGATGLQAVKGMDLVSWLASHTHSSFTVPDQASSASSILSSTVYLK